jgi:penicillin-binding protein 2
MVLLVLLLVLVGSFFRAQVLRGTSWALKSDSNRLRVLAVPAPRGAVFDRNGRIIADNVPSYSVSLFPAPVDSIAASLERLKPLLSGLSDERTAALLETFRRNRRVPLLVKMNLEDDEVAALEELRADLPGLFLEMRPRRRVVGGAAMGHVIGYVGEISAGELESPRFTGYESGMIVGKEGLERQYEAWLQGRQGVRFVEVDAVGRVVGSFLGQSGAPPIPGEDLHLHLDLGLQRYIHEIFPEGMRGAVVVLNVEDGGVLALYSAPSFDPNEFVGGISRAQWEALNGDPSRPLFNRAVVGKYPPASTWKLASAAIGLEQGVVRPDDRMPDACFGSFTFQGVTRRCWNPDGHGYQNMAEAIASSCNVYFYQLGIRIGLDRLVREGSRLGFNQPCGIDLPRESTGDFPETTEWWQRNFGYRPAENEVMQMVIGQGPNAQTPLRMAQFYLALARDGEAPTPQLFRSPRGGAPEVTWRLDLSEANLEALRQGLRQVMSSGTAFRSQLELWDLIGKTGTAQQSALQELPHAWFAGMAGPWGADRPEIAIVVIVEEVRRDQGGSTAAAPIAAKAADFYLRQKYGIPFSEIQTLAEYQAAGIPTPWAWDRMRLGVPAPEAGGPESDPDDFAGGGILLSGGRP